MIIEFAIASWLVALALFVAWKHNPKAYLVYAHILFLVAPLVWLAKLTACQSVMEKILFGLCSMQAAELMMYLIPIGIIISFITGYFIMPVIYKIRLNARYFTTFKKIPVYLVDSAKPIAFAIRNKIFISVGMHEILSKKEMEAVLLHELYHVKSRSSWNRFADTFIKIWSPFSYFSPIDINGKVADDELKADNYAIKMQKTSRYINSARNKLGIYNNL